MKKTLRIALYSTIAAASLTAASCRDTNPGDKDGDPDMGMTTDSVFTETDSINNNESTTGADTELDGE